MVPPSHTLVGPQNAAALTAGIYSRVSHVMAGIDRADAESIADQDDDCFDACHSRQWPVYRVYSDPNISASEYSDEARPQWDQLVADMQAGKFGVVVVWELSRADRKDVEGIMWLKECRRLGVLIHIVSHDLGGGGVTYDVRRPADYRKLSQEMLDNASASTDTSLRLQRHKRRQRLRGKPGGACPYGFQREYHPVTRKFVRQFADPTTAPIVVEIHERHAAGDGKTIIANALDDRGVPTPGGAAHWGASTIHKILTNWAYIGIIAHGDERHPAVWDGIVTEELFYENQRMLSERQGPPRHDRAKYRPGSVKYMLGFTARCGKVGCDRPMRSLHDKKRGRPLMYACLRGHSHIPMRDLDLYVSAVVVKHFSNPDVYKGLQRNADRELLAVRAELKRLEAELADVRARARALRISLDLAEEYESALVPAIAEAQRKERTMGLSPEVRRLVDGPVDDLAERWAAMPMAARRQIVRQTFSVFVDPVGRGRRVPVADRVRILPV